MKLAGASASTIRTSIEEGVLVVSLHRPDAAHARNQVMRDELADLWRVTSATHDIRAVVLTGSGERHFCAGMDLKEAARPEAREQRRERLARARDIELLADLPQPTIAAINGLALGGGLEMALACDVRIIAEEAEVALPEVTRGLVPGAGGTYRLPRIVGYSRACELILSGHRLTAHQAVEWGLAVRSVPRRDVVEAAVQLARSFAVNPDSAVRAGKALLRRSQGHRDESDRHMELDAMLTLLDDADLVTGQSQKPHAERSAQR